MILQIEQVDPSTGLARTLWSFKVSTEWSRKVEVRLIGYETSTRPTKRHHWRTATQWRAVRRSTDPPFCPRPVVPPELQRRVLNEVATKIVFIEPVDRQPKRP